MKARFTIVAAALLAVAAACSNENGRSLAPSRPSLSSSGTCSFTQMSQDARAYFPNGSKQVSSDIKQMSNDCSAGNTAAMINDGFNVLADIAQVTDAGTQTGTPAQGATLTLDVLAFMTSLDANLPSSTALTQALSQGGLYEVRGGNVTTLGVSEYTAAAYSRNAVQNSVPAWGASPQPNGNWTGGTRILIYGWPLTTGAITTNDKPIAYGFDFNRYPSGPFPTAIITGVCVAASSVADARIQHYSSSATNGTIFEPLAVLSCPASISSGSPTASLDISRPGMFASLMNRAWSFFAPTVAGAQSDLISGVGGLGSSWSPHIGVNLISVTLSEANNNPIASGIISQPIVDTAGLPVKIAVRSAGGSGLSGVSVGMYVFNNSGTNVQLTLGTQTADTVYATTNNLGIADFTGLMTNKAGGYTLVAFGAFDGIGGNSYTSNLFNMQNK